MNERRNQRLSQIVAREAMVFGRAIDASYHDPAAAEMNERWNAIVAPILSRHEIDLEETMDFACGHGRNARKLREIGAGRITLVDVHPDNTAYCEAHLVPLGGYATYRNNGFDLADLADAHFTHIHSFDSMVHFDIEIVLSYIGEFARVLRPGGTAFLHHSNYTGNPGGSFLKNPHWRNFMSDVIFRHAAIRAGFAILEQKIIDWGVPCLDCITMMRRGEAA